MLCLPFKNCFRKSSRTWDSNYVPKDAIQQDTFLSKFPEYDGRSIKIAIIDSGFDVSLDGLQQTSEGLPKVIDCFDFTGNGDVDTSVVKETDPENVLIGLSGKKFKIPKKWKNPSGKWHLGFKSLYKPTMSNVASDVSQKLPELDCIVWHDGAKWCACIETIGDLEKSKVLTNFRDEHEYGILRMERLEMTYCITIHNDGNLLEIFMPCDHHGSVVAQIAGAHIPKSDGVAPGAQLIFMCVMAPSDQYALNLEALKKALLKCIEMKVDIVNCSIVSFEGDDEITKIIREMANMHNILLFKCAGNRGPFYATTYKCDKNFEDVIFTIGALLTPEMKNRIYNVVVDDECPPVIYEFSSRGPGALASRGLHFVAPGAAVTRIPRFTNEKYNGLAGTSYSSPNAAGAVACLLSGLKANGIQYTDKSIKFVLTKTAKLLECRNKLEIGHGIIQINDAYEFYCKNKTIDYKKIPTNVVAAGGICIIRNDFDDYDVVEQNVDLSKFIEIQPGKAIAENWTLEVSPKTAEAFINLISEIDENNKFKVKIYPYLLESGCLKYAEIMIMDPLIGSICNIPVTVICAFKITETNNTQIQKEIILNYENPYHLIFYPVFESTKKCEIKITSLNEGTTNLYVEYTIQDKSISDSVVDEDNKKLLQFTPKSKTLTYSFVVQNKAVHEVCVYQLIGSKSDRRYNLEFDFKNDQAELCNEAEKKKIA